MELKDAKSVNNRVDDFFFCFQLIVKPQKRFFLFGARLRQVIFFVLCRNQEGKARKNIQKRRNN